MRTPQQSGTETRRRPWFPLLSSVAALLLLVLLCAGPRLDTVSVVMTGALTLTVVATAWLPSRPRAERRRGRDTVRSSDGPGPTG